MFGNVFGNSFPYYEYENACNIRSVYWIVKTHKMNFRYNLKLLSKNWKPLKLVFSVFRKQVQQTRNRNSPTSKRIHRLAKRIRCRHLCPRPGRHRHLCPIPGRRRHLCPSPGRRRQLNCLASHIWFLFQNLCYSLSIMIEIWIGWIELNFG